MGETKREYMRVVKVTDFLTEEEIKKAWAIYKQTSIDPRGSFARETCAKIIRPVIGRINQSLGQQNDPMYLAYAIENCFNSVSGKWS